MQGPSSEKEPNMDLYQDSFTMHGTCTLRMRTNIAQPVHEAHQRSCFVWGMLTSLVTDMAELNSLNNWDETAALLAPRMIRKTRVHSQDWAT